MTGSTVIILVVVALSGYVSYLEGNTIPTSEIFIESDGNGNDEGLNLCSNEFPDDFCEILMKSNSETCAEAESSESSALRKGCNKSCGFCNDPEDDTVTDTTELEPDMSDMEESETLFMYKVNSNYKSIEEEDIGYVDDGLDDGLDEGGKCEDKIPDCSKYLSVCCSMKDAMNVSCPKTCRFCTETPTAPGPVPPGAPAPTGSTNQDPCDTTNPPSVTVDAPGQTTTTTTLAPTVTGPTAGTLPPVG